jgi:hypothetical protein
MIGFVGSFTSEFVVDATLVANSLRLVCIGKISRPRNNVLNRTPTNHVLATRSTTSNRYDRKLVTHTHTHTHTHKNKKT